VTHLSDFSVLTEMNAARDAALKDL